MRWVREFYKKQAHWAPEIYEDPGRIHKRQVQALSQLGAEPPETILELGAGGGQFAASAAAAGYNVVTIELIFELAQHIEKIALETGPGRIEVLSADFYKVELDRQFAAICYWDGFGIGSDHDQKNLLKRIHSWLEPEGFALLDIYTPWYWASVAGRKMSLGSISRTNDFDFKGCRMLDSWQRGTEKITQSLRCYSPADLKLLLQNTGLQIDYLEPGGAYDHTKKEYKEKVPLAEAMTYMVKLKPA